MTADAPGLLYRQAHLDEAGLRAMLTTVFEHERGWAFGGNTVILQEITPYAPVSAVPLTHPEGGAYDFGHVFTTRAEVRWKRAEDGTYDALVLTEQPIPALQANQIEMKLATRHPPSKDAWLVLNTPEPEKQRGLQWRLGYVEYIAENQAVLLVRLTELATTRRNAQ
ncbi:MAG: hypothetical protein HC914_15815 [Chloroflexaceae bacterium]|nr:hypothetical protein [Chloroflexaceae bacterium]